MGKREKKTGKGRLDKYYKLAKEQGYRARSAFKLIQLDKKFEILKNARCLIDLCAAPGGWLQVATKYMPPNSIILGVDLVPIKPIPRVITAAQDITTDKCRKWLREEMRDWKADVVLHDGAPNVGTAWAQDAFTQSELVLSSMKLAVEFLTPGGTFVTKVFRSKDYNSLLWVFNQLFSKVEATKPPSSRNVSAEIFVVCSGFLAPKRIDPKLLNPTHVFKDLDAVDSLAAQAENAESNKNAGSLKMDKLTPAAFNVFHPDKKRRAREGYDEGDYTLFKQTAIMDFIKSHDPIAVLGSVNQLRFTTDEEKAMLKSEATTGDIVSSCEDLKVLGKRDFKALLKWRGQIRDEFGYSAKSKEADEFTENAEVSAMPELDEEEQMALDIERMETEDTQSKKKAKRRANERKTRDIQRMQLHMTTPMDIGLERQDGYAGDEQDYVFDLNEVEGHGGRTQRVRLQGNEADDSDYDEDEVISEDDNADAAYESDEEDARYRDLESNLDQLYDEYQNTKLEKDAKHKVKEARKKRDAQAGQAGEWGGIGKKGKKTGSDAEEGSGSDEEDQEDSEDDQADTMAYFDEDGIPADEKELDSSDEENVAPPGTSKSGSLIKDFKKPKAPLEPTAKSRAAAMWFDQPVFKGIDGLEDLMRVDEIPAKKTVKFDEETAEEPTIPSKKKKGKHIQSNPQLWEDEEENVVTQEEENAKRIADYGLTTPEAMTLAQQLVNREKTKSQLISEGFNKTAFMDKDGLPTWFLDDEMKHFRNNIPVTKEAVDAIRIKMRALNARPIKKVAEAKARKKMKSMQRLAKAQKKADFINETDDISEKDKAQQIARLVSRATKEPKKKKDEIKVVVAKGQNKGMKGRPKGVKGRFKMVDSRGKKEVRALKRIERRDAGKKRKR